MSKKISRAVGVLYKLRPFVTPKILTNVYYAIVYPFLLYGIAVWGNSSKKLLEPILILQKKIVRMITYNDTFPKIPGPLAHTPPLFHHLKMLRIYDIYSLQIGKFVFESENNIGPSHSIIKFVKASEIHEHGTRYSERGGFYVQLVRTSKYGLKAVSNEGRKVWESIPVSIRESKSRKLFVCKYKELLIDSYI